MRVAVAYIYSTCWSDVGRKGKRGGGFFIFMMHGQVGLLRSMYFQIAVTSATEALRLAVLGAQNRRVASTAMNRESSRSHALFCLTISSKVSHLLSLVLTRGHCALTVCVCVCVCVCVESVFDNRKSRMA